MSLKSRIRTLLCLNLLLLSGAASAQNELSLGTLEPGQLVLNLSLTEQAEVDQDTLNANLQFVIQGRDERDLQNRVNEVMQEALDLVRASAAVEYNTSFYNVHIVHTNRPTSTDISNPVFRVQQGLQVHSKDSAAVLALLGKLQELGLTLNGLHYSLSSELHEEISAELLNSALSKLRGRATNAAEALGKSHAELVEVNMDASPNQGDPRPYARMEAMAVDSAFNAPVADPGKTRVAVTVSGRAILSP